MKNFYKILISIFVIGIVFSYAPTTEAQFLKKLSKGLEKVNKKLEEANKFLDGNSSSSSNKSSKSTSKSSSKQLSSKSTEIEDEKVSEKSVIDDSKWDVAKPKLHTPFISRNTKFLQIENTTDPVSPVNDGVFSIKTRNNYFSFWKVNGEKLFDAEWQYCGEGTYGKFNNFPAFFSGVAAARRTTANYTGKKVICLLYLDGSIKELDPAIETVTWFSDGLAIATKKVNYKKTYYYINIKGERVFPHITLHDGEEESIRPLRDGLRAYFAHGQIYGKWGYINEAGKVIISPQFNAVDEFSEGYAWVVEDNSDNYSKSSGTLYLIDKTGKIVFRPEITGGASSFNNTVSKVVDGIFYVRKNDKYHYYDTKWNLLGVFDYGTPFYNGYAFVSHNSNYGEGIDMINTEFEIIRNFTSSSMGGCTSLKYQPRFEPIGLSPIKDMSVNWRIITPKGETVISSYHKGNDEIDKFDAYTASGYSRVNNIQFNGKQLEGLMNTDGELEWLFGTCMREDFMDGELPIEEPIDTTGFNDPPGDSIPEIIDPRKPPIGPKVVEKTYYNVTVSTEGKGTANISPTGRFQYGDNATLSTAPEKDWAVSEITVETEGTTNKVEAGKAFMVTSNMHIKVKFIKKDDDLPPTSTGCYQGSKSLILDKNRGVNFGEITYYAQINASSTDTNPYGDNTYGFISIMFDPKHRYIGPDYSTYIFSAPFRICAYQYDEATQTEWIVLDGGSFTFGNVKLNPKGSNGIDALLFQLMFTFDGHSSPTVTPRRYRIQMLNHNKETGEFTCGKMQTFSAKYGWINSGDKRLSIKKTGLFSNSTDYGLPDDMFEGVELKAAQKRNDIIWYPPVEWYNGQQSILERIVNEMGIMYRTHKTDYDQIFNQ